MLSDSITNAHTLKLIKEIYEAENYLLDSHGAVSLAVADVLRDKLESKKLVCLATAHPAKFPKVIQRALDENQVLTEAAFHHSIEIEKKML
ncbi:hypothetical protein [Maribacter antarcticus]|uniref:hypothetical protein n=1 Tax=Maribacter antarcticus TaxID=505250 RepID=UPI00047EA188|nr:hypothetical protein [Maribacter antarcticus]